MDIVVKTGPLSPFTGVMTLKKAISRRKLLLAGAVALTTATTGATNGLAKPVPATARIKSANGIKHGFDRERFVEDCIGAHLESDSQTAVREVLNRAVSDHRSVLDGLGEPTAAGFDVLISSPTLTIFAAAWTPQMYLLPHDHRMWALIGIYTGREDNILWREGEDGIEASTAECLFAGDVAALEENAIHSVSNPLPRFTGGIHIYGGDFFATERRQWDPETLIEEPSNGAVIRAMFARENEKLGKLCS